MEGVPVGVKTWAAFLGLAHLCRGSVGQDTEVEEIRQKYTVFIYTMCVCVYGRKHVVGTAHDCPATHATSAPLPRRFHHMAMTPGCVGTAHDCP